MKSLASLAAGVLAFAAINAHRKYPKPRRSVKQNQRMATKARNRRRSK